MSVQTERQLRASNWQHSDTILDHQFLELCQLRLLLLLRWQQTAAPYHPQYPVWKWRADALSVSNRRKNRTVQAIWTVQGDTKNHWAASRARVLGILKRSLQTHPNGLRGF